MSCVPRRPTHEVWICQFQGVEDGLRVIRCCLPHCREVSHAQLENRKVFGCQVGHLLSRRDQDVLLINQCLTLVFFRFPLLLKFCTPIISAISPYKIRQLTISFNSVSYRCSTTTQHSHSGTSLCSVSVDLQHCCRCIRLPPPRVLHTERIYRRNPNKSLPRLLYSPHLWLSS